MHNALVDYAVRLVLATRAPAEHGMPDVAQLIQYGASPRASLGIVRATRALALLRGRDYALPQDVQDIAPDILRHRLVLSYDALADDIPADHIVARIMQSVPLPSVASRQGASPNGSADRGRRRCSGVPPGQRRPSDAGRARAEHDQPARADGRRPAPRPCWAGCSCWSPASSTACSRATTSGLLPGPGSEAGESREYRPGDDVRRMDWPVTARTTLPHVRRTVADRELETWLAVDLSASLDFGTARWLKRDLVIAAAAAMAHLTVRGGNRIGAVVGTGAGAPTGKRRKAATAEHGAGRAAAGPAGPQGGPGSAAGDRPHPDPARPRRPRRPGRHAQPAAAPARPGRGHLRLPGAGGAAGRGRCASSASGTTCWPSRWSTRASWSCPTSACSTLADPETGELHEVQTADPKLRSRYAEAAAEQRGAIARALRAAGAAHLRLRTDSDWLLDIVRFVAAQRHARTRGTTR